MAAIHGGGIYAGASDGDFPALQIINTTITNNTADNDNDGTGLGGGIIDIGSGSIQIQNTIIAQNFAPQGGPDCWNTFDSLGNNLIGTNSGCDPSFPTGFPNGNGDFVGTEMAPLDPKLEDLALSPPGSTPVHLLQSDSIAIDNGDNGACAGLNVNNEDQRGVSRPQAFDGTSNCDIGAVELQRFEQFSTMQSIRVTSGFNVPFYCGEERVTFTNGADLVETVELNETIITVVFPETRINSRPSVRDQSQIVQSLTLTKPANFLNPGAMSIYVLATLNPGKAYEITCEDLRGFPERVNADGNIASTIQDALSSPDDFFRGMLKLESSTAILVSAKKIKRVWVINDAGNIPAYSDGEQLISQDTFESSRASGSRLVNFFVSKASLPVASASANRSMFGPPKPESFQRPKIVVLDGLGRSHIEFRVEGLGVSEIEVTVYGLSGMQLFREASSGNRLRWNLRDKFERPIANGIYLYVIKMHGLDGRTIVRSEVKKLLVMR